MTTLGMGMPHTMSKAAAGGDGPPNITGPQGYTQGAMHMGVATVWWGAEHIIMCMGMPTPTGPQAAAGAEAWVGAGAPIVEVVVAVAAGVWEACGQAVAVALAAPGVKAVPQLRLLAARPPKEVAVGDAVRSAAVEGVEAHGTRARAWGRNACGSVEGYAVGERNRASRA